MTLTGCAFIDLPFSSGPASEDLSSVDVDPDTAPVQDTWIYERIRTVSSGGEILDITEEILSALQTDPEEALELFPGAIFTPLTGEGARIITGTGEVREDLDVVAGITRVKDAEALQIIATPTSNRSVDATDSVWLDLGLDLEPNAPLITDFTFGQGLPSLGEEDVEDGVTLLATRMAARQFQWFGVEGDGEQIPGLQTVFGTYAPQEQDIQLIFDGGDSHVDHAAWHGETPLIRYASNGSGGEIPAKAQPVLEPIHDVAGCDSVPIRCVGEYFKDMAEGFNDSLQQIFGDNMRPDPPGSNPDPPRCIGSCGSAITDPHLRTFDGVAYDMQLVGEFVMAANEDLSVQIRTEPMGQGYVSVITAVSVQIGDHLVSVTADTDDPVTIDGETVADLAEAIDLGGLGTVSEYGGTLTIEGPADTSVRVRGLDRSFFNVYVDSGNGVEWVGLLGSPDGDASNDLSARDGTVLPTDATVEEIYESFADSWRLTDEESHFEYAQGEDTEYFTDRSYPRERITAADLPEDRYAVAETVCRLAGITEETILQWCILDYGLTGEAAFIEDLRFEFVSTHPELATGPDVQGREPRGAFQLEYGWGALLPGVDSATFPAVIDAEGNILVRAEKGAGSTLFSLDGENGSVRWQVDSEADVCAAITDSHRLVALIGADGRYRVHILDPATGETISSSPTQIGGCDHAEASGETVLLSHGTDIFGFDADHEVIGFESGMPGLLSPAVVSEDGRVWSAGMFDGEAHAVEFLLPSGDADVSLLPVAEILDNVTATERGFVAGYREDDGSGGLLRFNPEGAMSGAHPTPLPNSFDGQEADGDPQMLLSTDGQFLAGHLEEGRIGVFDVVTGEPLRIIDVADSGPVFVHDGAVATTSAASWLETFDAATGTPDWHFAGATELTRVLGQVTQVGPATHEGGIVIQAPTTGGLVVALLTPEP